MATFQRRESPPEFSDYRLYKPFLRKDFLARCAYCERTEHYLGGEEAFEVEHSKPKARFPDLVCSYGNLYYVCRKCNAHKSEAWRSASQAQRGLRFADPCSEDLYAEHVQELDDGSLDSLTPCGLYSNSHIRLDRKELRSWRRLRVEAQADLRWLPPVAQKLERLASETDPLAAEHGLIINGLAALKRRIEESKL
jgi:hypothetical protein